MTMDENTRAKYEEKIKTLLAMAKKKKNVLEYQEISDHFADLHLEEEQMDEILDALEKSGIDPADIAGVGICGHGKGLYLWGKDNRPLRNGIISTDNRIKLSVLSSFYKVSSIFAKSIISCLWIIRSNTLVASYCRKG